MQEPNTKWDQSVTYHCDTYHPKAQDFMSEFMHASIFGRDSHSDAYHSVTASQSNLVSSALSSLELCMLNSTEGAHPKIG